MTAIFRNFFCFVLALCLAGGLAVTAFGQDKKPPKEPKVKTFPPTPMPGAETPGFFYGDGITSERSMMVDPNVAIKLCVAHGDLRINGWSRSEVRVFVKHGRSIKLKALEKSAETGKVNWLWVGNVVEGRPAPAAECLAGESIEIDAPLGAYVDLSAQTAQTSIDSIKKVKVKNNRGVINLRNVKGGIEAYTGRGDVIVESSGGAINLESTTGNIVAVEVNPGQIGDVFRARTNSGSMSLQKVEHRQIQASTISGTMVFDGKFLSGGIYNFRTTNGEIKLGIPPASSCTVTATYGEGSFNVTIPHKIVTENITPQAKIVVLRIGAGNATVNLTTSNGSINIQKQN